MNMVKSLLLGSAAGVVAVAGAQAADLPVKARPVEYVKICSLYGDGFYYIPGTDTCIRVGGYVRADYFWNGQGSSADQPIFTGANASFDRTTSHWDTRMRANVQLDTRTQTAYGTLRTFTSLNFQNASVADTLSPQRAFIQFAGFTFGRTVSFSDVPGSLSPSYGDIITQQLFTSQTESNGVNQISYTWELGNGVTLTAGSDERRVKSLTNLSTTGSWSIGSDPTTNRAGNWVPDANTWPSNSDRPGARSASAASHIRTPHSTIRRPPDSFLTRPARLAWPSRPRRSASIRMTLGAGR